MLVDKAKLDGALAKLLATPTVTVDGVTQAISTIQISFLGSVTASGLPAFGGLHYRGTINPLAVSMIVSTVAGNQYALTGSGNALATANAGQGPGSGVSGLITLHNPEPSTLALALLGLGLVAWRKR